MTDMDRLFKPFPKTRPPLSPEMKHLHKAELLTNRERRTVLAKFSNFLESWMHRRTASDGMGMGGGSILEIGGGTLNHLRFEPGGVPYDVIEPFSGPYADKPQKKKVWNFFEDMGNIDPAERYQRIADRRRGREEAIHQPRGCQN